MSRNEKWLLLLLGADVHTLLIVAGKVPPTIKQRVMERPEVFRRFAALDDRSLDRLVDQIGASQFLSQFERRRGFQLRTNTDENGG